MGRNGRKGDPGEVERFVEVDVADVLNLGEFHRLCGASL